MSRYEHTFSITFVVVSDEVDPDMVDSSAILHSMREQVDYLTAHPERVLEVDSLIDTNPAEEDASLTPEPKTVAPTMEDVRKFVADLEAANVNEFGHTADLAVARVIDQFKPRLEGN